ncbi:MAG: hypothetical protein WAN36_01720, partial [Calditrichia bacterium]
MKKLIYFIPAILLMLGLYLYSAANQRNSESPHGNLDIACEKCHDVSGWDVDLKKISFDHQQTGFPLLGVHQEVQCRDCHESLEFSRVGSACADCHTDVHRGELGNRCESCHTPRDWENRRDILEAHNRGLFPLVGVHAVADCEACHSGQRPGEFANTPVECSGCHLPDFRASRDPNHQLASFSMDCEKCHQVQAATWQNTTFIHPQDFPLTGAHSRADCDQCHAQQFAGTPNDCYPCHETDFQRALDPNHVEFGFLTECSLCHTVNRWEGAVFDHLAASGFEIAGAHQQLQCMECHTNNQATGLPRECFGCHDSDFNSAEDPDHVNNAFSRDCLECHNETAWAPSTFNHAATQFPLTGAHNSLDCIDCHAEGYTATPSDCYSCHQADFTGVADPSHVQNNFSQTCTECHNTSAWSPATFDHNNTGFPLTGAHNSLQCIDCHTEGYSGIPTDCYSCHQADFTAVADPNHVQNNFSHDCQECHNTSAWSPSTFNHNNTGFPLTGAHNSLQCIDCHANGYTGTPTDCYSCHQADFTAVADPNHVQNNFSQICTECHNTSAWSPATFNHNNTGFPLTGAHNSLQCIDCHANGYTGTPTDCYSCHQA